MSAEDSPLARWQELAADAVLVGHDEEALGEVARLTTEERGAYFALRTELDLLAGELTAASHDDLPPMPAALVERLSRTIPGAASPATRKTTPSVPVLALPTASRSRFRYLAPMLAAALLLLAVGWRVEREPVRVASREARALAKRAALPPAARAELLTLQGTQLAPWKRTTDAGAAQAAGDVVWHSGLQRGYMRIVGLPANDPRKNQYQLWIFDSTRDAKYPVDGGVFDVTEGGEVVVPITAALQVRSASLFAVTIEPPGGVVVSSREHIVLTASPGS